MTPKSNHITHAIDTESDLDQGVLRATLVANKCGDTRDDLVRIHNAVVPLYNDGILTQEHAHDARTQMSQLMDECSRYYDETTSLVVEIRRLIGVARVASEPCIWSDELDERAARIDEIEENVVFSITTAVTSIRNDAHYAHIYMCELLNNFNPHPVVLATESNVPDGDAIVVDFGCMSIGSDGDIDSDIYSDIYSDGNIDSDIDSDIDM